MNLENLLEENPYLKGQVLLIDKPLEWSSFQVVNKLRWLIRKEYKIKKINYHFVTPELQTIFFKDSASHFIRSGAPFDYYELEKQQERIVTLYKNNGYFYFSKNHFGGFVPCEIITKN